MGFVRLALGLIERFMSGVLGGFWTGIDRLISSYAELEGLGFGVCLVYLLAVRNEGMEKKVENPVLPATIGTTIGISASILY